MSNWQKKAYTLHKMRRSRFAKCLVVGSVLTASALVGVLDSQARQSNVYSLNVGSFFITGPRINCYRLEREWSVGKWTNNWGFHKFALRQWGGGEEYDARDKLISGHKVYTEVAVGSHSFNIKLPLVKTAMLLGSLALLAIWATVAGAMWLAGKRRNSEAGLCPIQPEKS